MATTNGSLAAAPPIWTNSWAPPLPATSNATAAAPIPPTSIAISRWNWLVVGLFSGCSLLLYDGSPLVPTPTIVWDLVDKLGESKCLFVI